MKRRERRGPGVERWAWNSNAEAGSRERAQGGGEGWWREVMARGIFAAWVCEVRAYFEKADAVG